VFEVCRRKDQQPTWYCESHRPIRWKFPIISIISHCSVNVVQTAAKCDTQHRSASCCSNVIT
jgi:hypothetical protein